MKYVTKKKSNTIVSIVCHGTTDDWINGAANEWNLNEIADAPHRDSESSHLSAEDVRSIVIDMGI